MIQAQNVSWSYVIFVLEVSLFEILSIKESSSLIVLGNGKEKNLAVLLFFGLG